MAVGRSETRAQSAAEEFAVKLFFFLQTTSLPATQFGWGFVFFLFPRNMTFQAEPHDPCARMGWLEGALGVLPHQEPSPGHQSQPEFCVSGAQSFP